MSRKNIVPKIALIGAGYWGSKILANLKDLGLFYAYVDDFAFHDVKKMSFEEVLEDDNIDGVMIATPSNLHYEGIVRCLNASKHVFVEKPLCLSLIEMKEIKSLAEEKGLIVMVGYLMFYHPVINFIKDLYLNGELGQIKSIIMNRQLWVGPRKHEHVWHDLTVHDVSILFYLFGSLPVVRDCFVKNINNYGCDYFSSTGSMLIGKSMVDVHITSSWLGASKQVSTIINTDKNMWIFSCENEFDLLCYDNFNLQEKPKLFSFEKKYPLSLECKSFSDALLSGCFPDADLRYTAPIMQWLFDLDARMSNGL